MENKTAEDNTPNIPKHIAIIMDGNGRWAKARGKTRLEGHKKGAQQVKVILNAVGKLGVKYLTLYAFSSENWNRPKLEVEALMRLLVSSIKKYKADFLKNQICFRTIGDISKLPKKCIEEIDNLKEITKNFDKSNLVLALNYGSRDEIVRAIKKMSEKNLDYKNISWEDVADNLDTANIPDPDLIIRTSGEMRMSNYLMLQSAYSELYFTQASWPDFCEEELNKAILEYQNRERRYGLTGEQIKKC